LLATNSGGTSYGDDTNFTTASDGNGDGEDYSGDGGDGDNDEESETENDANAPCFIATAAYSDNYPKTSVLIFFSSVIAITSTLRVRRSNRF